jgi:S1-C subfamily serine protease
MRPGRVAWGAAFFIATEGYLVTNAHVVKSARSVHLFLDDKKLMPAKVIAICHSSDLAILKVDERLVRSPLPIVSSADVKPGALVFTLGYPHYNQRDFTSAKLSKGEIVSLDCMGDTGAFKNDVPMQGGNSGGALVDARGNVVGVMVASRVQRDGVANTKPESMATKSNLLLNLVDSVPGLMDLLSKPSTAERPAEAVIHDAEMATVLLKVE